VHDASLGLLYNLLVVVDQKIDHLNLYCSLVVLLVPANWSIQENLIPLRMLVEEVVEA
jgi:hypothetical protein